jgi:probable HAF family extracellular repeat protein
MTSLPRVGSGGNGAVAFNANGVVVGFEKNDQDDSHLPVIWRAGTGELLPLPPGMIDGSARSINDRGDVVGAVAGRDGVRHGFYWNGSTMTLLAGLPGGRTIIAQAINDGGQIAGTGATADGHDVALRWSSPTAQPTVLGPAAPDNYAFGYAITPDGAVGGSSDLIDIDRETDAPHAALWISGSVRVLDALSGPGGQGQVMALNNTRQAVGGSATSGAIADMSHPSHATLWDSQGRPRDLGTLPTDNYSLAQGLSNSGYVVGVSGTFDYANGEMLTEKAFVWTLSGGLRQLAVPHLDSANTSTEAFAVDDNGTVAGFYAPVGEPTRAALWSCVIRM